MGSKTVSSGGTEAWYAKAGLENDVVLSCRVRLARNLVNFPFPGQMKGDDPERVRSLVFDSFRQMEYPDQYQTVCVGDLDSLGIRILSERGVISASLLSEPWAGVVMRADGVLSCTVNDGDHVRLASFVSGLNLYEAWDICRQTDLAMQERLQFAASREFGFLTPSFRDLGSGMRASALLHLPSVSAAGMRDRVFRDLLGQGYAIAGYYGVGVDGASAGGSLGALYQLSNENASSGDEEEQLEFIREGASRLLRLERNACAELVKTRMTSVMDQILRAFAVAKFSRFIGNREGTDLISKIKWGLNLGILQGISHEEITALLYRIQDAHLHFVLKTANITLEEDITGDDKKMERLRAIVIQEAFSGIEILHT
ncbi:MAG: hypothetical protein LBU99_03475 [Spirochaetaceae bacterium]|jgi:protein arginine kinase|nr:hypothetical protein [Spirochaetaceae bacterium]